jgi:hypothetical protein
VGLRDPQPGFEGLELAFSRFEAGFRLPIPLTKKPGQATFLLAGASYEFLLTEATRGGGEIFVRGQELHGVDVQLGLIRHFGPRWRLIVNVAPGFAGDFIELEGDGFRFQGVLLVTYRLSDSVSLGAGVLATTAFGQPLPMPGLTFEYRKPKFRIDAFLPLRLDVAFSAHEAVELGIGAHVSGNNFDISNDETVDAARFSQLDVSAFAAFRLTDPLWISVSGGPVVGRRFDFVDGNGETLQDLNTDVAGLIRIRLEVRADFEAKAREPEDDAT